jgi:hypothetical protein
VLLFSPIRTEPDIAPVGAAATDAGKRISIMPTTLRNESQLELPFIPDLVLVPGLAFTRADIASAAAEGSTIGSSPVARRTPASSASASRPSCSTASPRKITTRCSTP